MKGISAKDTDAARSELIAYYMEYFNFPKQKAVRMAQEALASIFSMAHTCD
ncbi:hypothetical protein LOC54_05765 [Acetobacter sp. AN02]|uniref:hypothetical protein n=1 Tax=Acetobacter sp. AN02 TaxID=2894186 RepID=UPI0024346385|nr:hypothetical protein [Acetobacter sp. AN02]MDG6094619.1 hypothetical protein [Acetobacter sp. AN02]